MLLIYLDHNVVDDVGKGALKLKQADSTFVYIYSSEHFAEIKRAGDTRFLETLRQLRAQRLELQLDEAFRITDSALLRDEDPVDLYEAWLRATGEVRFEPTAFLGPIVSRAFGADNGEARVVHDLVFLIGQGLDGRDGDAVAGVDAHGVEVLDAANDDAVVGFVAHHFHLVFLPAEQRFFD